MTAEPPDPDRGPSDLLAATYLHLREIAEAYLRNERASHTLQPTALVHEAWMRLSRETNPPSQNATQFAAVAALTMRRILVDHARRKKAERRGGIRQQQTWIEDVDPTTGRDLDLLALDEALDELARLHPRHSRVVELRFFGGLSLDDVAEQIGVARSTAAEDWRIARAWLSSRLDDR